MVKKFLVIACVITLLYSNPTCDNNPLLNQDINPNAPSSELIPKNPVTIDLPICGKTAGSGSCCTKDAIQEQQAKWSKLREDVL